MKRIIPLSLIAAAAAMASPFILMWIIQAVGPGVFFCVTVFLLLFGAFFSMFASHPVTGKWLEKN